MQLAWHYLKLYSRLGDRTDYEPVAISLPDLAGMLYCTERNVKLIVRKMTEAGWIDWTPGRGRGNSSRLVFLRSADEVVLEEAKSIAGKGRLAEALEMMRMEEMGEAQRQQFLRWMSGYFGYSVETDERRELDILRLPVYKAVDTLDPGYVFYALDTHLVKQLFDTLFKYENDHIIPHLAYSWEESESGLAWSVRLRKGVRFHNGEEMTAEHVVRSFERLKRIGSPHSWQLAHIQDIAIAGRYKLVFHLRTRNVLFLEMLCFTPSSIVYTSTFEDDASIETLSAGSRVDEAITPLGTGPFRLARRTDRVITLEANDDYFKGRPHLDRVDLWLLPESMEREMMEMPEGAGSHLEINHRSIIDIQEEDNGSRTVHSVELCRSLITCNLSRPGPLQDKKLRYAIDICLDRERMTAELGDNRLGAAHGLMFNGDGRTANLENTDRSAAERLAHAKQWVAESSYNGETLGIFLCQRNSADAYWVRDRLAEIGVKAEVVNYSVREMTQPSVIAAADMILYGIVMDEPTEPSWVELYELSISFVRAHMSPQLAEATGQDMRTLLAEADPAERMRLFRRIEERLIAERQVLPLLRKMQSMVHDDHIKGASFNSLGWADLPNIWFD